MKVCTVVNSIANIASANTYDNNTNNNREIYVMPQFVLIVILCIGNAWCLVANTRCGE